MMNAILTLALAASVAGFTGLWERDPERSDDPREKMQAAMERMRDRREGRGGRRPGGGFAGRGRGGRGPGGQGPMSFAGLADTLDVRHEGSELHVDDGSQLRIYYLDGEMHERGTGDGTTLETTAQLAGDVVSIEEKMDRGSLLQSYELSSDGETLTVTRTIELGGDPVVVKTVYDRVSDGE